MLLGTLTLAGVALLAPVPDGAFVGTFVGADATSLVVRADDGGEGTFLLDPGSDMPAGFVTGTRIVVRFEALGDGRFRAASVSPPRIPLEADVLTTLPSRSEALSEPVADTASMALARGPSRSLASAEKARSAMDRPSPRAVGQAREEASQRPATTPSASAAVPVTAAPRTELVSATREASPPRLAADWPLLLATLLGATALLAWGLLRYR